MFSARKHFVFIVVGILTLILLVATIGSQQYVALARPNFGGSAHGVACGGLWDYIKDLRAKSDAGTITAAEQANLDRAVNGYNSVCRDTYGGNPRIAAELGLAPKAKSGAKTAN
jgi:hypothetical protein